MTDPLALAAEGEALVDENTNSIVPRQSAPWVEPMRALCAAVRELVGAHNRLDAMRHEDIVILYDRAMQAEAKRDALAEALRWYADTHHVYLNDDAAPVRDQLITHTFVSSMLCKEIETGARARAALAKLDADGSEGP